MKLIVEIFTGEAKEMKNFCLKCSAQSDMMNLQNFHYSFYLETVLHELLVQVNSILWKFIDRDFFQLQSRNPLKVGT